MLDSVLKWISANGVPNYFGHQRFGMYGDNWGEGKDIVEGKLKMRDRKKRDFLISAYQSYLFNNWLGRRIEISRLLQDFSEKDTEKLQNLAEDTLKGTKQQKLFFKIIEGDVLMHYPYGRLFYAEDMMEESERFALRDLSPTGLISGKKPKLAIEPSRNIEQEYDMDISENGSRRYAWIFPEDIKSKYIPERAHYELGFFLPKGSYATGVVDMLRGHC